MENFRFVKTVIAVVFVFQMVVIGVSGVPVRLMSARTVFSQARAKSRAVSSASSNLQAEMQEQLMERLSTEIQNRLHQNLSEMIAAEVMKSEELDFKKNAKSVMGDFLLKVLQKAKAVVARSCDKLALVAQDKLKRIDEKLEEIASEGMGNEDVSEEPPQQYKVPPPSQIQLSQSTVEAAFAELQNEMETEKWWDAFKVGSKIAFKGIKKHFKNAVKGFADLAKPLLAKAMVDFMPKVEQKVDELLGNACDYVHGQIKGHQTALGEGIE